MNRTTISANLGAPDEDPLRLALLDSRERWRDIVLAAADLIFETDAMGRFAFVGPDPMLGWSPNLLVGQPVELLLADIGGVFGFNPFRPVEPIRRRRGWLKRRDGSVCAMRFSATPLFDRYGRILGARGVGVDVTEQDGDDSLVASALRRGEMLDHILWRMRQEVLAPRMMEAALDALAQALGAEGAAVVQVKPDGEGSTLLFRAGNGAELCLSTAGTLLAPEALSSAAGLALDGRAVLVCGAGTRFGERIGLMVWRTAGSRGWDEEEHMLIASGSTIIRIIMEHDTIQREMARQARTDGLTGLYNRRAFLEELDRNIERLDREELPGTLMFLDLDHFKQLNDVLGHEAGDEALRIVSTLLRKTVRPTDLVARFGGDEFAVWLNGADHLTAAERAEDLRINGPRALEALADGRTTTISMSIGIATRQAGSAEDIDTLLRRADLAMYEVKRAGKGHWLVAREEPG